MESDRNVAAGVQLPLFTDEQLLFTAEQAAQRLQVGRTTLYALIKEGELHAVHIGRSCRLSRTQLVRYVARLDLAAENASSAVDFGAQVVDLQAARHPSPHDAA